MALAAAAYERTGEKQRVFADLSYGARSWNKERRVIARLKCASRRPSSHHACEADQRLAPTPFDRSPQCLAAASA